MISVIIPAFNRAVMLKRAVESVLSQSYTDFELIVVDDGSSEDLSEIEAVVVSAGGHFIKTVNSGPAHARNEGAAIAGGEWLSFLDSDDLWLKDKLKEQVNYHRENPNIKISQCAEVWYRNGRRVNPRLRHSMPQGDAFLKSLELCCISPSSVMISRSLFESSGGFDPRFKVCEDYELWLRITLREKVGFVKKELVIKHGGHPDQLSRKYPAMDRFRVAALLKLISENQLDFQQKESVKAQVLYKTQILLQGAEKRGKLESVKLYRQVLDLISSGSCSTDPDLIDALLAA
ncbi:MAG: glycosyltransferase [Candidatus Dadabacteria bacterium]|nr:MAG: glycosyltransferase [Candidatus Dadabacteria bacterium]